MSNDIFFSVIIPTYNSEKFISRTLSSAFSQDYDNFEVILSDDGSNDKTVDIINRQREERKDIKTSLLLNRRRGPGGNRNQGVLAAKGNWIAFLDSDDLWYNNKLSKTAEYIEKNPLIQVWCHSEILESKKGKTILAHYKKADEKINQFLSMYRGLSLSTSAVIAEKNILLKAGLFDDDENFLFAEDLDLWLRLAKTAKIGYIKDILGIYREHDENLSSNAMNIFHGIMRAAKKHRQELKKTTRLYFIEEIRFKSKAFSAAGLCFLSQKKILPGLFFLGTGILCWPFRGNFFKRCLKKINKTYYIEKKPNYSSEDARKEKNSAKTMDKVKKTEKVYTLLWEKFDAGNPFPRWHFDDMQELIPEPIVRGKAGIEVGAGCGYDSYIMAKNNPHTKIVSMDISDGIYTAKEVTRGLKNISLIKASALNIPLKDELFEFAYSYGVLHHTPDPWQGIKEIRRVLKKGSPVFLYLYEDHSGNPIKYFSLKLITLIRKITTVLPPKILYAFCFILSPLCVILFTYPARILGKFKATVKIAESMPFNFGTHPFSLKGDLYDRFSAPIEYRFSKKEVFDFLNKNGFTNVNVARIKSRAGWVAWGIKR